jgi:hypothetical protein
MRHRNITATLDKKFLTYKFDEFLAKSGSVVAIILILYVLINTGRLIWLFPGLFILSTCLLYLYLKRTQPLELPSISVFPTVNTFTIGFFILYAISTITLILRPEPYERPILYFFLIALLSCILFIDIIYSSRQATYLHLFQVILLGLSLSWSQLFIFPGLLGIDPHYHQEFVMDLVAQGTIPRYTSYTFLPIFHLIIGVTSILTATDYKMAVILSAGLLQIVMNVLAVYLIAAMLFNNHRVGLLASLFVVTSGQHIFMNYATIPNSLAIIFIPLILYLFFILKYRHPIRAEGLGMVCMLGLVLTHTIAALGMAFILFVAWGIHFFFLRGTMPEGEPISLKVSVLFLAGTFAWWTYVSEHTKTLALLLESGFNYTFFVSAPKELILDYSRTIPFSEQLFTNMGLFLFWSLALVGIFFMISYYHDPKVFILAVATVTPLAIGFAMLLLNLSVIQQRWWFIGQILMSIPLAASVLLLYSHRKAQIISKLAVMGCVALLVFLMVMNFPANMDNNQYTPNSQIRLVLTTSEIQSFHSVSAKVNGSILMDEYYLYTQQYGSSNLEDFSDRVYSHNFTPAGDEIFLVRDEILTHPSMFFSTLYKVNYDLPGDLSDAGYSKIYTSESVEGFYYS